MAAQRVRAMVVLAVVAAAGTVRPAAGGAPTKPVISGSGAFRYEWDPTRLVLPPLVALLNGHGLARDQAGNIYFTYEAADKADPAVRALVRFGPDGRNATLLGDARLAQGVPHGLKAAVEGDGREYLYHANNGATVHKTTLDGAVVWTANMTAAWAGNATHWPFKPTDLLVPPGQSAVFVADGYGLSKVHEFDAATGAYTGRVFGGHGDGDDPLRFNCDHGLSLDTRVGRLVVSDRSNHRLCWIDDAGALIKTVNLTGSVPLPCNAQTSAGTSLGGSYLIVPGLGLDKVDPGPWLPGNVAIFDANNTLVSSIEVARLLGVGVLGHTHPHDAIFLANGDIAVAIWKGHEAGSVGGLEYWRRLPSP